MLEEQPDLQVVGEAKDGLEAIQKAIELKPDLVLMEINLAAVNGLEVARRMAEAARNVKILFVSQTNDADVIAAALSDGAYGYILKIDAGTELLPAIRATVRGEHFVNRQVNGLKRP
jgi:DNA-binding NarL/FixJ family response regulator